MGKLEGLRERIGDELTDKLVNLLDAKEAEALELGMTPKEKQDEKTMETADNKTEAPVDEKKSEADEKESDETGPDVTALAGAFAEALKPIGEQLTALQTQVSALETTVKEYEAVKTSVATLQTELKTTATTAKEAKDGVTELKGEMPRGQRRHRASEDDKNVTEKEAEGPTADPLGLFIGEFVLGGKQPA